MKPYLLAPVAIAGLVTAAGTATIATAELNLVKTGQQVASLLSSNRQRSIEIDQRQLDAYNFRKDAAAQLRSQLETGKLTGLPSEIQESPVIDVDVAPAKSECPKAHARRLHLVVPRATAAPEALSPIPQPTLASPYTYHGMPALANLPKGAKVYIKSDKDIPFIRVSGMDTNNPDAAKVELVFQAQKLADKQVAFARTFTNVKPGEWKDMEQLKKLPTFEFKIGAKNAVLPNFITIHGANMTADAEKMAEDAAKDAAPMGDDQVITGPRD